MKRKLDKNNEPVPATEVETPSAGAKASVSTSEPSFTDLGLDPRLLQAVGSQHWKQPTLVQSKAIPIALDGRDVLCKAKTGSGKTAAYVLPVLQAILKRKQQEPSSFKTTALILVPTRELSDQVAKAVGTFSSFAKDVQTVTLSNNLSDAVQRSLLANADIVVATPSKAWHNIQNSALSLDGLAHLVLDEADLVLSYGYEEDLQNISNAVPKGVQTTLMSATLTTEVDTLKGLFCRNPTLLDLAEPEAEGEGVDQYFVKCAEDEKFLLAYIIFKLRLVKGKVIIFVADVDRCYRLKLFFEQFGIRSCILNSELPVNSRIHVVEEFNRNVYDIIIASDENEVIGDEDPDVAGDDRKTSADNSETQEHTAVDGDRGPKRKRRKGPKRDREYGVSRGIDFKNVTAVINFDLPTTSKSYTHRIGRTARAGQSGMALSFIIPQAQFRKHIPTSVETAENDEKVLAKIIKAQDKRGKEVKPYVFDMKQVEAFKYRMNDALRAVTKVAIREARTRELRQELLKSEKLKRHFEENPAELHHLRHDGELRAARTQSHLKHVPEYLLPREGKKALTSNDIGFVPFKKDREGKGRRGRGFKGKGKRMGGGRKALNPLKSFKGRTKSK